MATLKGYDEHLRRLFMPESNDPPVSLSDLYEKGSFDSNIVNRAPNEIFNNGLTIKAGQKLILDG